MPNVKMGADISSFKSGIAAAKSEVKTLDQQMKMLDATMKAEGKSEQTLSQQTQTLNSKMAAQRNIAQQAEAALKAMSEKGIDPASEAYQRMARELLAAQTGMMETQASLNDLGSGAVKAAEGADKLETGLKGITKKISLDQVISGIDKISDGLKNAAKHAINLGESLFNAVMDKAKLADDNATMALMYGIDLDTYLKMQGLVASGMDTSVDAILKAQSKLNKGIGDGKAQETLRELKITMSSLVDTGDGILEFVRKDPAEMFWEIGNAIMAMGDAYDKEAAAQNVFGRSWKELVPLFKEYHSLEEYQKALDGVQVISEESNNSLVGMADSFDQLHQKLDTLTTEILAQFAPGLTSLADSLSGLLTEVLEYLETPEGKEALAGMAESITNLFSGLKDISADDAVNTFKDVFEKIVSGFQWISEHGEEIKNGLLGIGGVWAALEVSEGVLTVVKVIEGIKGITASGAATSGAAAGAAWGGAFAKAVMAAAPWLVGLYTLLNPAGTANDNLDSVTNGGFIQQGAIDFWTNNPESWNSRLMAVGNRYGNMSELMSNKEALNIILDPSIDDEDVFEKLEEQLGVTPIEVEIDPTAPEGAAQDLASQIGTVEVPVVFVPVNGDSIRRTRTPQSMGTIPGHANGLPFVPYDGYLALLHQGERVMTATENRHYTYNSHNYFGNVNLNNGQDIENLCDRIDVHNRRQQAGYGG